MPGPCATNHKSRPDTGSTDKRARRRLEARVLDYTQNPGRDGEGLHKVKPGSQNRKK